METEILKMIKKVLAEDNRDNGEKLCAALCNGVNTFASSQGIVSEALQDAKDQEYRIIELCTIISLIALSYESAQNGCWDDRKKAAVKFAEANVGWLYQRFEELTGFPFPSRPANISSTGCVARDVGPVPFRDKKCQWMYGFLSKWINEHSTLKQSFIRGTYNAVLIPRNPGHQFQPNYPGGVAFPLV